MRKKAKLGPLHLVLHYQVNDIRGGTNTLSVGS